MSHYKLAHTVMVDTERGTILHLRGDDLAVHPAHEQIAVINEDWLERLTYAMTALNDLRERQAHERFHLEQFVREILDQSHTLNEEDIPKRVSEAFRAAHQIVDPVIPAFPDFDDPNEVPF